MSTIRKVATLGLLVVGSLGVEASNAVAQHIAVAATSSKLVSPSIRYSRHDWVVDMRRGDGDPRRHTCLSGVFARDGAYYPLHDHLDAGSLQHVDRSFSDGRGGYYQQRGFVWLSHGNYRESTGWTHYRWIGYFRP